MHDYLIAYFTLNCEHTLGNAQLLRELNFCSEVKGHKWPSEMKAVLYQALKDTATTSPGAESRAGHGSYLI